MGDVGKGAGVDKHRVPLWMCVIQKQTEANNKHTLPQRSVRVDSPLKSASGLA